MRSCHLNYAPVVAPIFRLSKSACVVARAPSRCGLSGVLSPSCHSCYRSVVRPACTEGSGPASPHFQAGIAPIAKGSGSPLLERRGGIGPPHVRNVAYSHCFRFCSCTPHICSPRLDCHAMNFCGASAVCRYQGSFQRALSFSVRRSAYSHIIRLRSGIWSKRQGLNLRHTSWRGALPTELRLRMSPLGHIVERCAGSCQLSRFLRLTSPAGSSPVFLVQTAGFEPAKTCWIPPRSLSCAYLRTARAACRRAIYHLAALAALLPCRTAWRPSGAFWEVFHGCKKSMIPVPKSIYAHLKSPVNTQFFSNTASYIHAHSRTEKIFSPPSGRPRRLLFRYPCRRAKRPFCIGSHAAQPSIRFRGHASRERAERMRGNTHTPVPASPRRFSAAPPSIDRRLTASASLTASPASDPRAPLLIPDRPSRTPSRLHPRPPSLALRRLPPSLPNCPPAQALAPPSSASGESASPTAQAPAPLPLDPMRRPQMTQCGRSKPSKALQIKGKSLITS